VKSTTPVGVPAPGAVTLTAAVKVTVCPKALLFLDDEEDTVVVVAALFTVWRGASVAAETAKLASPAYVAVIE